MFEKDDNKFEILPINEGRFSSDFFSDRVAKHLNKKFIFSGKYNQELCDSFNAFFALKEQYLKPWDCYVTGLKSNGAIHDMRVAIREKELDGKYVLFTIKFEKRDIRISLYGIHEVGLDYSQISKPKEFKDKAKTNRAKYSFKLANLDEEHLLSNGVIAKIMSEISSVTKMMDDVTLHHDAISEGSGFYPKHYIITEPLVTSEGEYQELAQRSEAKVLPDGPVNRPNKEVVNGSKTWVRKPSIASVAIVKADFKCLIESSHSSFISNATKQQYVEAHHIFPMSSQSQFKYSLDVPENIAVLCPNCHKKIHLAEPSEKKVLIRNLLDLKAEGLKQRGIVRTYEELCELY